MQGNQWSQQPKSKQKGTNCTSAFNFTSNASKPTKLKINPGSTVGFLVYLPVNTNTTIDNLLANTIMNKNTKIIEKSESQKNSSSVASSATDVNIISPLSMSPEPPRTGNTTTSVPTSPYVFRIHIDGVPCEFPTECDEAIRHVMADIEKLSTPLFPTVSLLSNNTRIWCRFCEADMVYRNRQVIGVENNVRVYCVDGSILIHESEE